MACHAAFRFDIGGTPSRRRNMRDSALKKSFFFPKAKQGDLRFVDNCFVFPDMPNQHANGLVPHGACLALGHSTRKLRWRSASARWDGVLARNFHRSRVVDIVWQGMEAVFSSHGDKHTRE
jgi:hypothetical protein